MLLQHYNYLAIKAAQKPHYGLSWGLVGLGHIRCAHSSSSSSLAINLHHLRSLFCSNHFMPRQNCPRSLIMLNYQIIKVKFWLTMGSFRDAEAWDVVAGFLDKVQNLFPIVCDLSLCLFVQRESLTHWKCTKKNNKDMCHTFHPYYAGNDKWDRQSLQHTVHFGTEAHIAHRPSEEASKPPRNVNIIKDGVWNIKM